MRGALIALAIVTLNAWADAALPAVSFNETIVPVLKAKCAICHLSGQETGNLALHPGAAYSNLVGVKSSESEFLRVRPGSPEQSYLLMKLKGTHLDNGGKGARMPFNAPPLGPAVLDQIESWIAAGAADN